MSDLKIDVLRGHSRRVLGSEIDYVRTVDSTMDRARLLAEQGAPEGLIVLAERQTKGRGRFDRKWVSSMGRDLLFSVVVRPEAEFLAMCNMAATIAVQDVATAVTGKTATIKWPNDVMMFGRKVSGILMESVTSKSGRLDFAVIGVGINVNLRSTAHPEIRNIATSLAEQRGAELDRTEVLDQVLSRLDELYASLLSGVDLSKCWADRIDTIGREVEVNQGGEMVYGKALGVDRDGSLIVETEKGTNIVVAGEVTVRTTKK